MARKRCERAGGECAYKRPAELDRQAYWDNARAAWSDRYYAPLAPSIVHHSVGSIRRLHGDGRVDTATVRPGVPNLVSSRLARAFL